MCTNSSCLYRHRWCPVLDYRQSDTGAFWYRSQFPLQLTCIPSQLHAKRPVQNPVLCETGFGFIWSNGLPHVLWILACTSGGKAQQRPAPLDGKLNSPMRYLDDNIYTCFGCFLKGKLWTTQGCMHCSPLSVNCWYVIGDGSHIYMLCWSEHSMFLTKLANCMLWW